LDLSGNALTSLSDLEQALQCLPALSSLDLRGNPMCRQPRYRESIAVMADQLETIDGQGITMQQKQILLRLQVGSGQH
jgi:protein phosphatase 1 regulatory subunit 42